MQAVQRMLAMAVLALLGACAFTYQHPYEVAEDLGGDGHSAIQIGKDLYKVSYVSSAGAYPSTVETNALRRASELAIEAGRPHFLFEDMQTTDNSRWYNTGYGTSSILAFTTKGVARLLSAQEASQTRGKTVYDAQLLLSQLEAEPEPPSKGFLGTARVWGLANYANYQINQNTWQVCRMSTKKKKSAQQALKRAAELTLAQGRTHFSVRAERMLSAPIVKGVFFLPGTWHHAAVLRVELLTQAEAKRVKGVKTHDAQAVLRTLEEQRQVSRKKR